MLNLLMYFNFVFTPLYIHRRFKKNGFLIFLNPSFMLVFFSYFYLTLSSIFINIFLEYNNSFSIIKNVSFESIEVTNFYCSWFSFVFLIFYLLSSDRKGLKFDFKPKKITVSTALFFTVLTSGIFLLVLFTLYTSTGLNSRVLSLEIWSQISEKYRLDTVLIVLLASTSVIVWKYRDFKWYLPLILPILCEFITQGRTITIAIIIYAYINYVAITEKLKIKFIFIAILFILFSVFLRFNDLDLSLDSLDGNILLVFSEIFWSRFSAIIVYDYIGDGNFIEYFIGCIVRILPTFLSSSLTNYDINSLKNLLDDVFKKVYGADFGVAGNLVSEALYQGGYFFAILSPFIIATIFFVINKLQIQRSFVGFIFYSLSMSQMLIYFRWGFYPMFFNLIWGLYGYLWWIIFFESKYLAYKHIIAPK